MEEQNPKQGITRRQLVKTLAAAGAIGAVFADKLDAAKIIQDARTHAQRSALSFDFSNLPIGLEEKNEIKNEITIWVDAYLRKHKLFVQQAETILASPARDPDSKIMYEPSDLMGHAGMQKLFSRIQITLRRSGRSKHDLAVDMLFFDKDGFGTYYDHFIERRLPPKRK